MTVAEKLYASVDLGGTKIACALGTADGEIVAERTTPTMSHEGPAAVVERMGRLINDLADVVGHHPAAVGIGVPGLVDLKQGRTLFLPNLPTQWREVPVRAMLAPEVHTPVYLLNDVRTATLGELRFGHGREKAGAKHDGVTMLFFALGTGIGGGVVIDGRLRLGPLGAAGELGHQTILPDGPLCGCGNRGCLETLASGPAIAAKGVWLLHSGRAPRLFDLVEGDAGRVSPKEMAEAAAAGDTAVRAAIVRAASYLGIGVANMVVALHPDLVVLGGSVAQMGPLLFETVRQTVQQRVHMFPVDDLRIVPSQLGNRAGVLGGIALAMEGDSLIGQVG